MIDAATRSTTDLVSDTAPTTHLLGLDTSSPLPAWMLLNAVRHQRFSGELTLHTMPAVRVWAIDGLVYWAERAGALTVGDRLVELGVVDRGRPRPERCTSATQPSSANSSPACPT